MEKVCVPDSKGLACVSAKALGTISIVHVKQPTDTENMCAKILSKGNGLKSSRMGSQECYEA